MFLSFRSLWTEGHRSTDWTEVDRRPLFNDDQTFRWTRSAIRTSCWLYSVWRNHLWMVVKQKSHWNPNSGSGLTSTLIDSSTNVWRLLSPIQNNGCSSVWHHHRHTQTWNCMTTTWQTSIFTKTVQYKYCIYPLYDTNAGFLCDGVSSTTVTCKYSASYNFGKIHKTHRENMGVGLWCWGRGMGEWVGLGQERQLWTRRQTVTAAPECKTWFYSASTKKRQKGRSFVNSRRG